MRGSGANKRRTRLQSRHFDEQIALDRRHEAARLVHFERLEATYDPSVYRDELQRLARKRFVMPWHRERIKELRLTIEDADRKQEQAGESFVNGQESASARR